MEDSANGDSEDEDTPEPKPPKDDPNDVERRARFTMLCQHFNSIRQHSWPRDHESGGKTKHETLDQEILRNNFIVLDEDPVYDIGWV